MPQPSGNEVVRLLPPRKTRRRRRDKIIAPLTINGTPPVRRKSTLSATMFRLPFKVPFLNSYPVYFDFLPLPTPSLSSVDSRAGHPSRVVLSSDPSKDIQILLYRSERIEILLHRFRILLYRIHILLYDMKAVMSLGMIVDTMTNIWDIWYIGRSHLLTQGLSHALLTYRIMAIFLLSDLIQQALFSPRRAYWIVPWGYPLVVVHSIATDSYVSCLMRLVSKV
ncbi:hypothetical protein D6D05_06223 [Aureobasidium pullulans]|nr:hypothetical protein D6D05_06223 [Aureobasidium pullulans]TIA13188.1 hypothetical protein D6C80_06413 [Aureobasidium pullulans]